MKWSKTDSAWAGLLLLGLLAVLGGACDARAEGDQGDGNGRARWERCEGGSDWLALMRAGKQLGAWNEDTCQVAVIDPLSGKLVITGQKATSPAEARSFIELVQNPGIDVGRLRREASGYRINGKVVTQAEAFGALKPGGKLVDDSALPILSIIGPAEVCKAVEADVATHPALQALRGQFLFQSFRPEDWQVSRSGFVLGGKPTVYMQAPDGSVLFRDDKYVGPELLAEAVAVAFGQCCPKRDPVPDYQPEKDRPARVVVKPQLDVPWGWIAGGLCAFLGLGGLGLLALGVVFYLTRRPPPPIPYVAAAPPPPQGGPPAA